MEEEKPIPSPDSPAPEDKKRRIWTALVNFGNILAAQAVPLVIGLASFIIAVDAWWSAKAVEWENDRALASMRIRSHYVETAPDERSVVTTLRVKNVGSLSFAVLDLRIRFSTDDGLTADWERNTLMSATNAALPLGIKALKRGAATDAKSATFSFDDGTKTWHLIDPGRSVEFDFVQPTHGSGRLTVDAELFTQPIALADMVAAITERQTIRGVSRETLPEFGSGEISDAAIFPYTGSHQVIIPPLPAVRK